MKNKLLPKSKLNAISNNNNIITTISKQNEKIFCKHKEKIEIYRCHQDRYVTDVCCNCGRVVYSDL